MKYILAFSTLLFFSITISAQDSQVAWFHNLEAAKTYADSNQADILMVFAGSDWCKPCIQFKKDVLENPAFQSWASSRLVVLYLDFPAKKKNKLSAEQTSHNEALAERFNKSGAFPGIFIIDTSEKILAHPEFNHQDANTFAAELDNMLTANQ